MSVPDSAVLVTALGLAAVIGFTAQQASLCTLRAVAELLSTRRGLMLLSFAKTVLWVIAVTQLLSLLWPSTTRPVSGWSYSPWSLLGGLLFGIGAAANGGCAISVISKLANGRLAMFGNLIGVGVGAALFLLGARSGFLVEPAPQEAWRADGAWTAWLPFLAVAWAAWESLRLWRSRAADLTWHGRLRARSYRLSTAAALLGISNGLLYVLYGNWAYSGTLGKGAHQLVDGRFGPDPILWGLLGGLLAGALLSAWQRHSFRLEWRPWYAWPRHLFGGCLMGFGGAMIPGGNDALLFHGIPGLSAHALPAFVGILCGIGLMLIAARLLTGSSLLIDCSGDVCAVERMIKQPRARRAAEPGAEA